MKLLGSEEFRHYCGHLQISENFDIPEKQEEFDMKVSAEGKL